MNFVFQTCVIRFPGVAASVVTLWAGLGLTTAQAALTDHGDGTVTDTTTGLMWDKCSSGQTGNDCSGGAAGTFTWQQALALAATANAANYKGRNDWRLPSVNELESLVQIDTHSPAIDTTAFPNTVSGWYWSATIFTPLPAYAWVVVFNNGESFSYGLMPSYVRLVRSGQSFDSFDVLTHFSGPTATNSGTASIDVSGPGCVLSNAQFVVAPAGIPAGVAFPHGLADFTITGCSTAQVRITYPAAVPAGAGYWKEVAGAYSSFTPVTVDGNSVTFTLTDNGAGDSDPAVGSIHDPSGIGVGGAGTQSIPTLSEWGMILLSGLVGLMAWMGLPRNGRAV